MTVTKRFGVGAEKFQGNAKALSSFEKAVDFWINQFFNGISYAALLFLFAGGLTLIFGVMNIVNIAHGSFYMISGYIGYEVIKLTGSYYLAIIFAAMVVGFLGLIIEPVFLRKMEKPGNLLKQMLLTMGIALILQAVCLLIWGGDPYKIPSPSHLQGHIKIGTLLFPKIRVFMIVSSIIIFFLIWWFQEKTYIGAKLRASVDNDEMASALGINVDLIRMGVFTLGVALCGVAGVIGGSFMGAYPGMEFEILPLAFVIVIVGGFGNLQGALLGSVIVGLVDNFGKVLFPELSYFTLFAPLVIIVAFRPTGILGKSRM